MLTIKSNAKEFTNFVKQLAESQVPFALSKALNVTAVEARDGDLHQEYKSTFEERNKAFFRQVHSIRPSSARDGKRLGRMVVAVQQSSEKPPPGTVRRLTARQAPGLSVKYGNPNQPGKKRSVADTDFMRKHVSGGNKKAGPENKVIAVPRSKENIPRNKNTGAIVKGFKPQTLIGSRRGWFSPNKKQGGVTGKLQVKKRKNDYRTLYMLHDSVRIKPQYKPIYALEIGVRKRIQKNFRDAMMYSLKTARFRGLRFTDDG